MDELLAAVNCTKPLSGTARIERVIITPHSSHMNLSLVTFFAPCSCTIQFRAENMLGFQYQWSVAFKIASTAVFKLEGLPVPQLRSGPIDYLAHQ